MEYESLYYIYYKEPDKWEVEYRTRFSSPFARQLPFVLRQYGRNAEHPAFFCYTEEIALLQDKIMGQFKEFMEIAGRLPGAAMEIYLHGSLIEEIKSTNDIEGVRSTRREIMEAMALPEGGRRGRRLGSVVDQYEKIIRGEEFPLKTCEDIRRLYDDFMFDEIERDNPHNLPDGQIFRRGSVDIVSAAQKTVHRGLYPETKIIEAMEKALAVLNDESIPVFVRVAIFHYLLGYIHPFYDGNGRLSRFITACFFALQLHPAVALGLSALIKGRRGRYYELFSQTEADINRGELTPFILGFMELTCEAVNNAAESLRQKLADYEKNLPRLAELPGTKTTRALSELLLQAALFSPQGITVKEMQKQLGKSENTIYSHLKKIPSEMLLVDERGRNYLYRLTAE